MASNLSGDSYVASKAPYTGKFFPDAEPVAGSSHGMLGRLIRDAFGIFVATRHLRKAGKAGSSVMNEAVEAARKQPVPFFLAAFSIGCLVGLVMAAQSKPSVTRKYF